MLRCMEHHLVIVDRSFFTQYRNTGSLVDYVENIQLRCMYCGDIQDVSISVIKAGRMNSPKQEQSSG